MCFYKEKNIVSNRGFTLIEFMIAITLGMVLIGSLMQVLVNNKQIANTETSLSRVQESGRFVMNLFMSDIRKIGYHGCSDPSKMEVTVMADDLDKDFSENVLRGFEVSGDGSFTPNLDVDDKLKVIEGSGIAQARAGSDVIQLHYSDKTGGKLTESTGNSANIKVDKNPTGLSQNDFAVVANCKQAHIFKISNVTNGNGNGNGNNDVTLTHGGNSNTPHKILPGYTTGADLLSFKSVTYFVGNTGRFTNGGTPVFSLYRMLGASATPEEMIEGVEYLQVLYGENLSSGHVRFVPADTLNLDMESVVAIRFSMLIQDFEITQTEVDTITYSLLDQRIGPDGSFNHNGGRSLRKPFTATAQLRNRRTSIQ